jgi:hypothetical protein
MGVWIRERTVQNRSDRCKLAADLRNSDTKTKQNGGGTEAGPRETTRELRRPESARRRALLYSLRFSCVALLDGMNASPFLESYHLIINVISCFYTNDPFRCFDYGLAPSTPTWQKNNSSTPISGF